MRSYLLEKFVAAFFIWIIFLPHFFPALVRSFVAFRFIQILCALPQYVSTAEANKICDDMCILPKITIAVHVLPFTARTQIAPLTQTAT